MQCWTGQHLGFVFFVAIPLLIISLLAPLLSLYRLNLKRQKLSVQRKKNYYKTLLQMGSLTSAGDETDTNESQNPDKEEGEQKQLSEEEKKQLEQKEKSRHAREHWATVRASFLRNEDYYSRMINFVYRVLFQGYKDETWWWEVVEICRKSILVSITVFFADEIQTQAVLLVLLSVTGMLLQLSYRPYSLEAMGDLDFKTQLTSVCIFYFGMMLFQDIKDWLKHFAVFAMGLAVAMWFATFAYHFYEVAKVRAAEIDFRQQLFGVGQSVGTIMNSTKSKVASLSRNIRPGPENKVEFETVEEQLGP